MFVITIAYKNNEDIILKHSAYTSGFTAKHELNELIQKCKTVDMEIVASSIIEIPDVAEQYIITEVKGVNNDK